jgi:hypothetical protein
VAKNNGVINSENNNQRHDGNEKAMAKSGERKRRKSINGAASRARGAHHAFPVTPLDAGRA